MNQTSFVNSFDDIVTEVTKYLPPDLIQYIKEKIESQSSQLFDSEGNEFEISIVIDTNVALSVIRYFVNDKQSIIFHLKKNPLFKLYAPHILKKEVLKYIDNKVNAKLKNKWLDGLRQLEKVIHFRNINDSRIKKLAMRMIGNRDKKDTPFVEVYIGIGAQGILTFDKDFEHEDIKIFHLPDFEDIVCTFQKGVFSFFIVNDSLEIIIKLLMDIILVLFSKIFKMIKYIFEKIKTLIMDTTSSITKHLVGMPLWLNVLLLAICAISAVEISTSKDIRNKISNHLNELASISDTIIKDVLAYAKKILGYLLEFLTSMSLHATTVILSLNTLLTNITNMEKEFKDLIYGTIVLDMYS